MERLTTNKSVSEMSMIELAHNSCYVKDRWAKYRDYETDFDARELAGCLLKEHAGWSDDFTCGEDFEDCMADFLQFGLDDIDGLIAVFYRNIWAMADLRERLKYYEDLEERGELLKMPCASWMEIVFGEQEVFWGIDTDHIENQIREITVENPERITWYDGWKTVVLKGVDENGLYWEFFPEEIGKTVFLTKEEAEAAMERMGDVDGE